MKTAAKNKAETTLRMSLKMLDGNNLPHELLLTARQKTKLKNSFNNNMSTDLKLSKIIQIRISSFQISRFRIQIQISNNSDFEILTI